MAEEKDTKLSPESSPPAEEQAQTPESAPAGDTPVDSKSHETNQESSSEPEDAMLDMLDKLPDEQSDAGADKINFDSGTVAKAEFQQLSKTAAGSKAASIDLLMDVNLPVSIELGRTQLSISEILSLGPGSVVELRRLAGEPVDVMVNHKLVARGEVVVVDENFGVRITQLITPQERMKLLGEE